MRNKILYSYCIPIDDGAAPNPYWGVCTLAICKPVIRRNANIGDWIVGTGSTKYHLENKVIYAMEVTDVKTLGEYYTYCKKCLPAKIPKLSSKDLRRRAGDCIYFEKNGILKQLEGVHNEDNYDTDTNGENVLLSDHFYYFGNKAVDLPEYLLSIVKQGQGHRSRSNADFAGEFINWIITDSKTKPYKNEIKSEPQLLVKVFSDNDFDNCSACRKKEGRKDEKCSNIC